MFGSIVGKADNTKYEKMPYFVDFCNEYNPALITEAKLSGKTHKVVLESVKSYILDKMYDLVGNKISKLDPGFKEIDKTNGKIISYKYYKVMKESIVLIKQLAEEAKDTDSAASLQAIFIAWDNLHKHSSAFEQAYMYSNGLVKQLYLSVVSAMIYALGFISSTMIKYETRRQSGMEGREIYVAILDRENVLWRGMPNNVHELIVNFNRMCNNGELVKFNTEYNKNPPVKQEAAFLMPLLAAVAVGAGIWVLPSLIRYTIYFFMHSKLKMAQYIQAQADLLEFNALKYKRMGGKNEKVYQNEMYYVERLRKFSALLSGDKYVAEKNTNKEIDNENKELAKEAQEEEKRERDSQHNQNPPGTDDDIFI